MLQPPFLLVFCLAVMACSSPGISYRSAVPVGVEQGGYRFDLYKAGSRVQGIRLSFGRPASELDFRQAFADAVFRAYRCAVVPDSLRGDLVVLTATVNCG